jgi:phage baseplate assembly protein W
MIGTTSKLGVGLRFPPVTPNGWGWVAGVDAVDQAVRAVLLTEPGERIGRPQFGAGLRRFLFRPNSLETRAQIARAIQDALPRDETRIKLQDLQVTSDSRDPTLVRIAVVYQVPPDPGRRSLIYPFYLDAGGA